MRHAISIPAGITKMPLLRFTTLTALAIIPWSIIFIYLGEKLGENWENINDIASPYVKSFAIGGVVLILLYFVIKKWTKSVKILLKYITKTAINSFGVIAVFYLYMN